MEDTHEFRVVITPFCNYRCFFCHSEGLTEEYTPLLLSPDDYRFAAGAAKQLWGWDTITITGGEPLVSPIYQETCELIHKEGVEITTITNASLVSSPRKILQHNAQVNVSLHTLDPATYKKITGTSYPLSQVLDTVISIRAQLPQLRLHLNSTVIRGMNDSGHELERFITFSNRIGAEAKFIDLASSNEQLVVPIEEIAETLGAMGFCPIDENTWQVIMGREEERIVLTRCGFGERYDGWGQRNLFLNPDGVISADSCGEITVSVLREIHERDLEAFAQKVEWFFSPAQRVKR